MATVTPNADFLSNEDLPEPALSSGLNILTILTFIGCALGFISGIYTFVTVENSYKKMQEMQGKLDEMPAFAKKMMGPEMLEMARKSVENKLPIMLVTIIGVAICLYGALEMRKSKKQGFILWVAGEFLPVIAMFIIMGAGAFSGFGMLAFVIPVIFLILYGVQRKNLIY